MEMNFTVSEDRRQEVHTRIDEHICHGGASKNAFLKALHEDKERKTVTFIFQGDPAVLKEIEIFFKN